MTPGVVIVRPPDLPQLERLWAAIARDEEVGGDDAGAAAIRGSRPARAAFDFLASDSSWLLGAGAEDG